MTISAYDRHGSEDVSALSEEQVTEQLDAGDQIESRLSAPKKPRRAKKSGREKIRWCEEGRCEKVRLAKLLDLAEITTANNADHGHTSTTNDTSANDTVITFTNGTPDTNDDAVVMVLEDYATDLTYADVVVEVI